MAPPFRQTAHSLERGKRASFAYVGLAAVALAAWIAWFALARVPLHQQSTRGRIESDSSAHPVQAPTAGTVSAVRTEVGRRVTEGDVLLEIDATALQLEARERRARLEGIVAEVQRLGETAEADRVLLGELETEGRLAVREAQRSLRGAASGRDLAEREAARTARLAEHGATSLAELERARTTSTTLGSELDALEARVSHLRAQGDVRLETQRVRLTELERALGSARSALDVERAGIERIQHDIEARVVRAPVTGRIGAVGDARVGSYLQEGDRVAVIVPDGRLRAVGYFAPTSAGRLRPGQPVVLRFPAYPWTAYGSRRGRVARVASEAVDGLLRVEMDVAPERGSPIPLEHGLEVVAEVVTEQVTPARLVLRHTAALLGERDTGGER